MRARHVFGGLAGAGVAATTGFLIMHPEMLSVQQPDRAPVVAPLGTVASASTLDAPVVIETPLPETSAPQAVRSQTPNKDQFPYDEVFKVQIEVPTYPMDASAGQPPTNKLVTYAWPIGRPHQSLYLVNAPNSLPCVPETCHHDKTYALDIAYNDAGRTNPMRPGHQDGEDAIVGEPIRAFVGGHIDYAKEYKGIDGCNQIKLHGEDGYYYWIGHAGALADLPADGNVQAGDLLAVVGPWKCVADSQSPQSYAHGHEDQGCVIDNVPHPGGNDPCRNRLFIEIMNEMFVALPQ